MYLYSDGFPAAQELLGLQLSPQETMLRALEVAQRHYPVAIWAPARKYAWAADAERAVADAIAGLRKAKLPKSAKVLLVMPWDEPVEANLCHAPRWSGNDEDWEWLDKAKRFKPTLSGDSYCQLLADADALRESGKPYEPEDSVACELWEVLHCLLSPVWYGCLAREIFRHRAAELGWPGVAELPLTFAIADAGAGIIITNGPAPQAPARKSPRGNVSVLASPSPAVATRTATGHAVQPPAEVGGMFPALVLDGQGKQRAVYINNRGEIVLELPYERAFRFAEEVAMAHRHPDADDIPVCCCINRQGECVFEMARTDLTADHFSNGLCGASRRADPAHRFSASLIGYIDHFGRWQIAPIYKLGFSFSDRIALVAKPEDQEFMRVIDAKGKTVVELAGRMVSTCHNGLFPCWQDGATRDLKSYFAEKWLTGYRNRQGDWAIPARYKSAASFSEGLAFVTEPLTKKRTRGLALDTAGSVVFELPPGIEATEFHEGYSWALRYIPKRGVLSGYLNRKGEVAIDFQYASADDFSEGWAAVSTTVKGKELYGFVDTTGQWMIPPMFQVVVRGFENGLALVRMKRNELAYIDRSGAVVWGPSLGAKHGFKQLFIDGCTA